MELKAGASLITWTPGSTIGSYELIRELARGGMGEIWLARQHGPAGFERLVVLKRIIASTDLEPRLVDMFLDEAHLAAQLQHPNVVQVFELGEHGGSYFLAMEYLVGQTVSRVARRFVENLKEVPPHLAVEIIAEAARGLGYAHRRRAVDGTPLGIVHRDVSPQNLFVTYDGHTKVLDFGVARAASRRVRTATGVIRGRLSYMSPEQALALPLAATADVFSLGVVLFELVTGTRLYGDAEDVEILRRFSVAQPLPRTADRALVDPELARLIDQALDWNPLNRFSDGAAFAQALDTWSTAHPQRQGSPPLGEVMASAFSQEIAALPTLQRRSELTPTSDNAGSLVDHRSILPTSRQRPAARTSRLPLAVGVATFIGASGLGWWLATKSVDDQPLRAPDAGHATNVVRVDASAPESPDASLAPVVAPGAPDAGRRTTYTNRKVRRGFLTLETTPWARVYLGPTLLGETPLVRLPLPGGLHQLRLVNEPEHLDTYIEVEVVADTVTFKRMEF